MWGELCANDLPAYRSDHPLKSQRFAKFVAVSVGRHRAGPTYNSTMCKLDRPGQLTNRRLVSWPGRAHLHIPCTASRIVSDDIPYRELGLFPATNTNRGKVPLMDSVGSGWFG